ncbi:chromosome transmission fidelity protein 8 homolog isoform X1 [Hylaeus volcanicus]|uniref:chromosome transmission fidelity protein 8 homolog isoform X1 n=1 Tax=Hylaeus volcanicus TaxID=313075 RepID=UPI0023B83FF8|nr:chromosome transmission fidelity protein 8 homolog isoform X1 [Hylaeus volcanicus]
MYKFSRMTEKFKANFSLPLFYREEIVIACLTRLITEHYIRLKYAENCRIQRRRASNTKYLYGSEILPGIIDYNKKDGELEEWAIIELQGDLKFASSDTSNKYIGDLHFTKSGTPILIIGIHVLHGKEVGLTKPFAVLQKKKNEIDATANESEIKIEYIVKAIVTKKLVFRSRPKPIVRNVPKFS